MFVHVLSTHDVPFQKQNPLPDFAFFKQLFSECNDEQLVTFAMHFVPSSDTKQPDKKELQLAALAITFKGMPSTVAKSQVFSTHFNVVVFHKQTGELPSEQLSEDNLAAQATGKSMQPDTAPSTGFAETQPDL
jgi:hypothetical protein